ncbi:MAG: hypothetical protein HY812_01245 [Planctomycetes bacterium]|nr:hypothetical protein [Planctomycetota bacterium]
MTAAEQVLCGRIGAGLTHELKNVLAIVRESAGLIQDILELEKSVPEERRKRVMRALAAIDAQVGRGEEMADRLNAFAHELAGDVSGRDVGEVVEAAAFLMRRAARSKRVALEIRPAAGARRARVGPRPDRLVLLLCACLERCLGLVQEGGSILLAPETSGQGAVVRLSLAGGEGAAARLDDLQALGSELGCAVTRETPPGGGAALLVVLPAAAGPQPG